jgi:hypothetical protein
MHKIKLLTIMLLLTLLSVPIDMRAAEVNGIRVITSDKDAAGKEITFDFLFTSQPKVTYLNTYDGKEVSISSNDIKSRFGKDEIILDQSKLKSISFMDVSATSISKAKTNGNLRVITTTNGLDISGLRNGETVMLYTLDGKQVNSATASANGNVLLRMPSHKSGTAYIVKVGKASFKVRTK